MNTRTLLTTRMPTLVAALALALTATAFEPKTFLESGKLELGANYWASHNATKMWREWKPEEIEKDFLRLKEYGMTTLRVFPTWSDFQPIVNLHRGSGGWADVHDTRLTLDENARPDDDFGYAGVDPEMMRRFGAFCDLAEKHGMKLVVAIMTGQMTFRLFLPPALENRDPYADPFALAWEGRFVECFVRHMKDKKAIVAWESGNESRALAKAASKEQAEFWLRYIHSVIREADSSRPVISVDGYEINDGMWRVRENAHLGDYVPHHLYTLWRRENPDRFDSIRNYFFAAAGVKGLEDVSGRPSFLEEHGARRAEQVSRARLEPYMRAMLWNLWAVDGKAMLWWCAFDQENQSVAPYDWTEPCLELGILKSDRSPYPAAEAMRRFAAFQKSLGFALPRAKADAVVLTTDSQVELLTHASYVLARQAGIYPKFANASEPIPDASCYFLPCAHGRARLTQRNWEALKAKVRAGATLYLSWAETFLPSMDEVCGLELDYREHGSEKLALAVDVPGGARFKLNVSASMRRRFKSVGAEILAKDAAGNPFFFRHRYGKGLVYTLGVPLEEACRKAAGGFNGEAYRIWQLVCPVTRLVETGVRDVNASEHFFNAAKCVVVVVNNGAAAYEASPKIAAGWKVVAAQTDRPDLATRKDGRLHLAPASGLVLTLAR